MLPQSYSLSAACTMGIRSATCSLLGGILPTLLALCGVLDVGDTGTQLTRRLDSVGRSPAGDLAPHRVERVRKLVTTVFTLEAGHLTRRRREPVDAVERLFALYDRSQDGVLDEPVEVLPGRLRRDVRLVGDPRRAPRRPQGSGGSTDRSPRVIEGRARCSSPVSSVRQTALRSENTYPAALRYILTRWGGGGGREKIQAHRLLSKGIDRQILRSDPDRTTTTSQLR